MRGFPSAFATKQDYLNGISLYPEQTRDELRRLLADRFMWAESGVLADGEDGVTDSTHCVSSREGKDGGEVRIQMERREDPNARLFRLGFTVKELEKLLP
jgi:hypothetical protein